MSLNEASHRVGEEVIGAEVLASKEMIQNVGIVLETLERLAKIGRRQTRLFFDDLTTTYRQLTQTDSSTCALTNHLQRRLEHTSEGFVQVSETMTQETSIFEQVLFGLWKPFFAVVDRDWKGGA